VKLQQMLVNNVTSLVQLVLLSGNVNLVHRDISCLTQNVLNNVCKDFSVT
jgi:hypothetical protein